MTGSPVLLLDLEVPTTFGQMDEVDVEVVIVDLDRLVADLDLTSYPKLKHVYFLGSSNFKVETNIQSTHIESKSPSNFLKFHVLFFSVRKQRTHKADKRTRKQSQRVRSRS